MLSALPNQVHLRHIPVHFQHHACFLSTNAAPVLDEVVLHGLASVVLHAVSRPFFEHFKTSVV
ncbi:hypothetical protein HMPREF1051_2671 [Neisseria sicca VK64]|uniref:Uncharacterized protein n=1 Tax=Neisseria sicca VK64 TaxID=1095748 RepID=I2NHJ2_NEISI|nr:hypothetical protein HMPREF1051_2671 [Neisseria sicca VK64]